jgi:hypothetical protein
MSDQSSWLFYALHKDRDPRQLVQSIAPTSTGGLGHSRLHCAGDGGGCGFARAPLRFFENGTLIVLKKGTLIVLKNGTFILFAAKIILELHEHEMKVVVGSNEK